MTYDKECVDAGACVLAEALDYAANACMMDIEVFLDMFITSGYAKRFEKGDAAVVFGFSGTELVCRTVEKSGLSFLFPPAAVEFEAPSPEYWTGYFLAYLNFYTEKSFREISEAVAVTDFSAYIPRLLEASGEEREGILKRVLPAAEKPPRLQQIRKECGYSQRELAEKSGVNLRTLQQYETGAKDINRAAAGTVLALADALGCEMTDIME